MAKMTYRDFDQRVQRMFATARENLDRDGDLSPVLLGVNAAGRSSMTVLTTDAEPDPAQVTASARQGVTLLAHPLRDRTEVLREQVAQTRTVALISIGLGWMLLGKDAAYAVAEDIPASGHPSRIEHVVVSGVWPREFYASMHTALVLRDEPSGPRAVDSFRYDRDSAHGPVLERMTSWLSEVLPPAPRR